jgi:hypothetical protein
VKNDFPESIKFKEAQASIQTIVEFMEWLSGEDYRLGKWDSTGSHLVPSTTSLSTLLSNYFDINENVLEAERQEMIKGGYIRHG